MQGRTLYLVYGSVILLCGLLGFLLTHAKSALISGLASGLLMIALAFFVNKSKIVLMVARALNFVFLGVFTWRSVLAVTALSENPEKLIPSLILTTMALASVVTLAISLLKLKKCNSQL